jgi:hypothetical protein
MGPIPNTLRPVFPDRHDFDAGYLQALDNCRKDMV